MNGRRFWVAVMVAAAALAASGCGKEERRGEEPGAETAAEIAEKWGKPYDQLEQRTLLVLSPHNTDIQDEFAWAFSHHHALQFGERVKIEYLDVGGGGNKILSHLRTVYSRADTANVDVVWGGGDANFDEMAAEGIIQPIEIPDDYRENVPQTFGGLEMYDGDGYWAGSAVSGFGFLYNTVLLDKLSKPAPKLWDDLAGTEYYRLIALADPMKSSSAGAAYQMIVQSADTWPDGWAKLLAILANAKKLYEGSSAAADAVISEVPIATCIDFYGQMRVAKYPNRLKYVSPAGQTVFNADPIAILKNPPHPQLAQRFVDFVLSRRGQALWALPPGSEEGPAAAALYRTPIREDVFSAYGDRLVAGVEMPFVPQNEMAISEEVVKVDYDVLQRLVHAAAVDNAELLREARAKLIAAGMPADKVAIFNELPGNIRSADQFTELSGPLADEVAAERIVSDWARFFADKYRRIAE